MNCNPKGDQKGQAFLSPFGHQDAEHFEPLVAVGFELAVQGAHVGRLGALVAKVTSILFVF